MKEFHVDLGGKRRRLKFTSKDGAELQRRFTPPSLNRFFQDEVMGGFTSKNEPLGQFDMGAILATLTLMLSHDDRSVDEDRVDEWLTKHLSAGLLGEVVDPMFKCAYYSGVVLGKSIDIEDEFAKHVEGKAPAADSETEKAAE